MVHHHGMSDLSQSVATPPNGRAQSGMGLERFAMVEERLTTLCGQKYEDILSSPNRL